MKSLARIFVALAASATIFAASRADADPIATDAPPADAAPAPTPPSAPPSATPTARESPVQIHLDAGAGISTAGAVVGTLGLVRFGMIEVGGGFAASGLFSSRTGGGLAIGAGGHRPGGGGWDVLFELGMNQQHVVGSGGFLSSDPGASGSIPYGGLRAGVDWAFGNPSAVAHATLGLWLFARLDVGGGSSSYSYQESGGFFSDRSETRHGSASLGGGGELGLTLAGGLDLLP